MRILLFLPVSCSNVLLQFFLGVYRRFYLVYVKLSAQHTGKFGALQLLLGWLGWGRFSPSSCFLMRERHHLFVGEEGVALIQSLDNLKLNEFNLQCFVQLSPDYSQSWRGKYWPSHHSPEHFTFNKALSMQANQIFTTHLRRTFFCDELWTTWLHLWRRQNLNNQ